jgi:hypothetical protein
MIIFLAFLKTSYRISKSPKKKNPKEPDFTNLRRGKEKRRKDKKCENRPTLV